MPVGLVAFMVQRIPSSTTTVPAFPLIEVVTKPILGTGELAPEIAKAYVSELRDLMRALGVSDVRMEEGSLRCDVNVSLSQAR